MYNRLRFTMKHMGFSTRKNVIVVMIMSDIDLIYFHRNAFNFIYSYYMYRITIIVPRVQSKMLRG